MVCEASDQKLPMAVQIAAELAASSFALLAGEDIHLDAGRRGGRFACLR